MPLFRDDLCACLIDESRYTHYMNRAEKLKLLNTQWSEKNTCALKTVATQPVFGSGNPKAEIVFIGEAPGKKEDSEGLPFVGASGKFLEEMLQTIGLARTDVYITNIVKYRPPNNRDPLPEEKEACLPWLQEELTVVAPRVVVFLGRHALNTFFPEYKISEVHGTLIHTEKSDIKVEYFLPLYHPASALYNGALRETLKKDFKKIPKILEALTNSTT